MEKEIFTCRFLEKDSTCELGFSKKGKPSKCSVRTEYKPMFAAWNSFVWVQTDAICDGAKEMDIQLQCDCFVPLKPRNRNKWLSEFEEG